MKTPLRTSLARSAFRSADSSGSVRAAAFARDNRDAPLPPAFYCERFTFDGISCYVAGKGPPLVLVHSVNAAASAAEMRPVFERYRSTRTVFAVDLPGFGMSKRADRPYTPSVMTDALHALAVEVERRCGRMPIDAVAASLGCEFLARAAAERPQTWGRLALVSPTGLDGRKTRRGPAGSTRFKPWVHALLSVRLWSEPLFRALTSPRAIRYFLQRTWGSKTIDELLWAYDVRTARQPGARFAPLYFLSGGLFSADIHTVYESVVQPVWFSHGIRGDFTDFRARALVQDRGNWRTTVFQTGALPYFEKPAVFFAEMDAFLTEGNRSTSVASGATEQADRYATTP